MNSNIEIFQTAGSQTQIEVRFEGDTVWLSQQQMAELFEQTKQNISLHIKNCYREGELEEPATVKKYLTVKPKVNEKYREKSTITILM